MLKRAPAFAPTKSDRIALDGGWDTTTPPLMRNPGAVRNAQNVECGILRGYRYCDGYERFSGLAKPSDAAYSVLTASITGAWATGNTLTGATSGATGIIVAAVDDGSSDEYFVLTAVSGTYQAGENLQIGGTTRAVAEDAQTQDGAPTAKLHAQYKNAAADYYRALIAAVPGSGDVRGVWLYNDVVYAFRNNAGGTACDMHKSSGSGWTAVSLGRSLAYTSGSEQIAEGSTITGATSGATAVLRRQTVRTGSVGAGSAVGIFVFATVTGTFQNGENLQVAAVTKAVANGADAAITMLPDGRFEFENANFGGTAQTKRMYGVDGVNKAFEFDGTYFVPIATGMTTDAPTHLTIHKNHLVVSFGGSVQHSSPGAQYTWSPITGASELAIGDNVTGFMKQPGSTDTAALAIFSRNKISVLYGTGVSNWNLVTYADEQGAYQGSIQQIGYTLMLDDRGLTSLQTSTNYGNFSHSTLSQKLQDWIAAQRFKVNTSCICRDKNQYRIFFNDNYALYVTMDGAKVRGMMPQLYNDEVVCCSSGEMNDGTEAMFFGSSDGFVYQMDKGTSFDGDEIERYAHLAFNFSGSPRARKRYKHAEFEIQGEGYSEFMASAEIAYGRAETLQPVEKTLLTDLSATQWDVFTWDAFTWDGITLNAFGISLEGTGDNISIIVRSTSDYFLPLTFSAVLLDYSERRRLRSG